MSRQPTAACVLELGDEDSVSEGDLLGFECELGFLSSAADFSEIGMFVDLDLGECKSDTAAVTSRGQFDGGALCPTITDFSFVPSVIALPSTSPCSLEPAADYSHARRVSALVSRPCTAASAAWAQNEEERKPRNFCQGKHFGKCLFEFCNPISEDDFIHQNFASVDVVNSYGKKARRVIRFGDCIQLKHSETLGLLCGKFVFLSFFLNI